MNRDKMDTDTKPREMPAEAPAPMQGTDTNPRPVEAPSALDVEAQERGILLAAAAIIDRRAMIDAGSRPNDEEPILMAVERRLASRIRFRRGDK